MIWAAWMAIAMLAASPVILSAQSGPVTAHESVRVLKDEATGDRWVLLKDLKHPGGPGRMTMLDRPASVEGGGEKAEAAKQTKPANVIHAGDRVLVEENTAVVNLRLEAVALSAAQLGATLTARLAMGGRLVRAAAVAPGRARLLDEARR